MGGFACNWHLKQVSPGEEEVGGKQAYWGPLAHPQDDDTLVALLSVPLWPVPPHLVFQVHVHFVRL